VAGFTFWAAVSDSGYTLCIVGSVIFDFDSTLVPCESLERILQRSGDLDPVRTAEIEALTRAGMEGRIAFGDALRRRLAIAQPDLSALRSIARDLAARPTAGAADLVARLHADGHEVWIVSGGLREILEHVGQALGIPVPRIHGVTCRWRADGAFEGLADDDGFAESKVLGLSRLAPLFSRPTIGVGDGATDLALREAGFVERFVAYTEFAGRPPVVAAADAVAGNMADLGAILAKLLA